MTNLVLSHLQTLSAGKLDPPSTEPSQLPQPENLSLECTAQSSSSAWREALMRCYLPWLWDLEPIAIAHKEASKPAEQEWNWELLVRQLAQVDLHQPRAVLENLPMGLRNRKRIWRLAEDMLSEKVDDS